jgi:hypothetical protein
MILEHVEGLTLDLPLGSTGAPHRFDRARIERDVRNPAPTSDFRLLVSLLVEQIIDTNIYSALAQTEVVGPGRVMFDPLWRLFRCLGSDRYETCFWLLLNCFDYKLNRQNGNSDDNSSYFLL